VNDTRDRRFVFVSLTPRGEAILGELSKLHKQEIQRMKKGLLDDGFDVKSSSQK
jgi:DNA-binding MarR family transcriptional regulator